MADTARYTCQACGTVYPKRPCPACFPAPVSAPAPGGGEGVRVLVCDLCGGNAMEHLGNECRDDDGYLKLRGQPAAVPSEEPETARYREIALSLNDSTLNAEPVSVNQVRQVRRFPEERATPPGCDFVGPVDSVCCQGCAFTFDSFHANADGSGYTCAVCEIAALRSRLAEWERASENDSTRHREALSAARSRLAVVEREREAWKITAEDFAALLTPAQLATLRRTKATHVRPTDPPEGA